MGAKLDRDDWRMISVLAKSCVHSENVMWHTSMANLIRQGLAENIDGWNRLNKEGFKLALQLGLVRK